MRITLTIDDDVLLAARQRGTSARRATGEGSWPAVLAGSRYGPRSQ